MFKNRGGLNQLLAGRESRLDWTSNFGPQHHAAPSEAEICEQSNKEDKSAMAANILVDCTAQ